MKRIWEIVCLLFILSIGMALAEDSRRRIDSVEEEYERVIQEIEIKRGKHDRLEKKEKSLIHDLDRLAFVLNRRGKELQSLEKEISQNKKGMASQQSEMRRIREEMSTTQRQIQTRAAALYRMSKAGPWAFFLSAESYGDFLRMVTFLSTMVDYDMGLLRTFQGQIEQRETLQKKLASTERRLSEREERARKKAAEVKALKQRQEDTLGEVRAAKTSYARLIEDLEKQAQRLQTLIEDLTRQEETSPLKLSGFQAQKGRLLLPVRGKIEENPQKGLRGITLKAPDGTLARAVYRGRVVYAGWFRGYGNLLIIDHGDRFHTVMGHASELLKKKDEWVGVGESVVRVGSTGSLGGASLYFEIRQDGKPLNPLEWFSKKDQLALK